MFLSLIFCAGIASADGIRSLTLQECCKKAREQLATVLVQGERIVQANERLRQAKAAFLPDVHFLAKKTFQDSADGAVAGEFTQTNLTATQSLFNGFKDKNLTAIASRDIQVQQLLYKSSMRDAGGQAVRAFYSVSLPEVSISNDSNNISMVQDRISELQSRVRLGKSRETELFSVQSTLASVRADLAKSQGDRTSAIANLALLIGGDVAAIDAAAEAQDSMSVPSLQDAISAVKNRSDLVAAREALEEQEIRVKFDKGAFLPTLNATGNYYLDRLSGAPSQWSAALALDMPLFQGGRDQAQLRQDLSLLRAQRIALDFEERQAETDVRTAHAALAASIEQFGFLKEANDKAEAAYQSLVKEYRLGLVNNLDVLAGLGTLLTAKSAYTQTAVQVRQNRALLLVTLEQL